MASSSRVQIKAPQRGALNLGLDGAEFGGRGKTQRKPYSGALDLSGAVALGFTEKTFNALNRDSEMALKRPWHKLDRGLRIGRLRDFAKRETDRLKLNTEDSEALFRLLLKTLDRKLLNSKAAVTYEPETEQITEIKNLVAHTNADGTTRFAFLDKKPGVTQRRRASEGQLAKDISAKVNSNGDSAPKNETVRTG